MCFVVRARAHACFVSVFESLKKKRVCLSQDGGSVQHMSAEVKLLAIQLLVGKIL